MTDILKKKTFDSPLIEVNKSEKRIQLIGSSNLIDPANYYQDLNNLIENYLVEFKNFLILDLYFDYLNTSSSKWMFHILKNLQVKHSGKKIIKVNWYYEEDDEIIQETGELFRSLLKIQFNVLEFSK